MPQLSQVEQVFLDMDGTIYHGGELFPTTIPFLEFLKGRKINYAFLTNNSSYSITEYIDKLAVMGIQAEEENFYTSTEYTIDYLKKHHPELKRLFILGMTSIFPAFEKAGFTVDDETPDAVIIAFDRSLTYQRLCQAAYFMRQDLPTFATHPDLFCPTNQATWLPDCGAITKCLASSTNKQVKVLGKPDPEMLHCAAGRYGVKVTASLMVGDRLSTDMKLGIDAGALTCHIVTPGADLIIPEGIHPDYEVANLGELQELWQGESGGRLS